MSSPLDETAWDDTLEAPTKSTLDDSQLGQAAPRPPEVLAGPENLRQRALAEIALFGHASPELRVGDYELLRRLGAGGMGEVFEARHVRTGQHVALKTLSKVSATGLYRFKHEFRALADVRHPNLVQLHDLGVSNDGGPFFTMELLDGVPFVDWVRRGTPQGMLPKRDRLEVAMRQLVLGVSALHQNGWIHRDLKPTNVLVTKEGRVVVLDFGLVSEYVPDARGISQDGLLLGTPAYMAPEQVTGKLVGPPADHYAIGVILHHCLTGRLPIEGNVLELLANKHQDLDLDDALVATPPRLRELCSALLDQDPSHRPTGDELLAHFEVSSVPSAPSSPDFFVGRHQELELLWAAYRDLQAQRGPRIVQLRGPSGYGKSALIRQFGASLDDENCLVLRGRCHQREAVPHKGFDAVVDALSVHLRRQAPALIAQLRPRSPDALSQMFPVLGGLWPDDAMSLPARELRGVAWAALRELLDGLSQVQPLAILIDDFQWTDLDSVELLEALIRPPSPPSMLLILALRHEARVSQPLARLQRSALFEGPSAIMLELGVLGSGDSVELATALIAKQSPELVDDYEWVETVARRSQGNPLLLSQIIFEFDGTVPTNPELHTLLVTRLAKLTTVERRALDFLAISTLALTLETLTELLAAGPNFRLDHLAKIGLVVSSTSGHEIAHSRVRDVVRGQLDATRRAKLHRELGEHLLARCDTAAHLPFEVVNQLNLGFEQVDTLAKSRRIEFAALNRCVGDRALRAGSYALAHSYFSRARDLLSFALASHPPSPVDELGFAIEFGLALSTVDADEAEAIFSDLDRRPLSDHDHGRVAVERMMNLMNANRADAALAVGNQALKVLGAGLPERPTRLWSLWNFMRGRRAITRVGASKLAGLHDARDERTRAIMKVLALIGGWVLTSDNAVHGLGLVGLHAQLVARHGFHDLGATGLTSLATCLSVSGKANESLELWAGLQQREQLRPMSAADRAALRTSLVIIEPRRRPIHEVATELRAAHRDCVELGQDERAEYFSSGSVGLHLEAGTQLPDVIALIDDLQAQARRVVNVESQRTADGIKQIVRTLIEGPDRAPPPDPQSFDWIISRYAFTVRRVWLDVLFGSYRLAAECAEPINLDYPRVLMGLWLAPIHGVVSSIAEIETQALSPRRHRALSRVISKHRSTITIWADACPVNYGPMATLIDAEEAALAGRFDDALAYFEQVQRDATANHMTWLAGLASARVSRHARERGLVEFAALYESKMYETYWSWGAIGLARHLLPQGPKHKAEG